MIQSNDTNGSLIESFVALYSCFINTTLLYKVRNSSVLLHHVKKFGVMNILKNPTL